MPKSKDKSARAVPATAIETGFPTFEISAVAEQESWRKEINRPLYHIHKWWATRLGSVFRAIILGALKPPGTDVWSEFYSEHDLKNKVVFDPFMGSGTTLGEALKLGAKAVGSDINPVSTFLVRQAFTRVPQSQLRTEFLKLEKRIQPFIKGYYRTIDAETGGEIPVLYYFWCKTVTTPGGETLPLMSRYVFAQDAYPKKKPIAQILCPSCWRVNQGRYDSTDLTCGHCGHNFDPQCGPAQGQYVLDSSGHKHPIKALLSETKQVPRHRLYAVMAIKLNGQKVYQSISQFDLDLFEKAERDLDALDLPLPTLQVRSGHNTDQARGYNYFSWRDFFNARQLICLGRLLEEIIEIPDPAVREQFLCLFSSTLEFNNMFCSFKGEGTGAVRHMFSNHILKPERTPLENSIWGSSKSSGTFSTLFESRLLRAKQYLDEPFELMLTDDGKGGRVSKKILASRPIDAALVETWDELQGAEHAVMVLNGDSANVQQIPDQSVDAVVTDPPYFDFVHYSELSDFFFAWLTLALKKKYPWMRKENSSDDGEVQHKNPKTFARQLGRVFTECHRVLKDDGIMAFSFHHSRPDGWSAIFEAIAEAGFQVTASHPVHAELKGASPKSSAKNPISLDAILVCRKAPKHKLPVATDFQFDAVSRTAVARFETNGMTLTDGDRFVIGAGLLLIEAGRSGLSSDQYEQRLAEFQKSLQAESAL